MGASEDTEEACKGEERLGTKQALARQKGCLQETLKKTCRKDWGQGEGEGEKRQSQGASLLPKGKAKRSRKKRGEGGRATISSSPRTGKLIGKVAESSPQVHLKRPKEERLMAGPAERERVVTPVTSPTGAESQALGKAPRT